LGHETAYDTVVVRKLAPGTVSQYVDETAQLNSNKSAAWYLVYAAAMCWLAVVNAIARELWFAHYTYFMANTIIARVAVIYVLVMMGVMVFAFVVAYAYETIMGVVDYANGPDNTGNSNWKEYLKYYKETWTSNLLHAEALIVLGSFTMKIFFFIAMLNASMLTTTEIIYKTA